jgi:hypothetical protein
MNRITKEQRDQILLAIISTLAVGVGFWYLLIIPQTTTLTQGQARIKEAKAKVEQASRLMRQKDEIEKTLGEDERKLEKIEDYMASGDLYAWAIMTLHKFIEGHKIKISAFSRETIGSVGLLPAFPYPSATFTILGTAFFHDFGTFLAEFENQFPYFQIQNLELSAGGGGQADNELLTFKMEIVTLLRLTETKRP